MGEVDEINKEAICVFAAIGFFLDEDTYYKGQRALRPGTTYALDESGKPVGNGKPWFRWYYEPRNLTLAQATDEFASLFEKIVGDQVKDQRVILPLSGGLDSRTQAAALKHLQKPVHAYGYAFEGGHDETEYGKRIAEACGFPFEDWKVPAGYLWDCIEQLAHISGCYSEFTHPRQMAFVNRYAALGDVFSVGHWGDVLFDDMGVPDTLLVERQVDVVLKKIVKKGGMELGTALWQAWGLAGDFKAYLTERVKQLMVAIDIPHSANARIRAFKSLFWAPRWTAVNLSIFESVRPITVPYFDNRMCQFICTVPEELLAKRQIQIEYLKRRAPELARIPWQEHRPFNLYTYRWDRVPYNLPYRALSKVKRLVNRNPIIQRNWELQFVGEANANRLQHYLFENTFFRNWVSPEVVETFYAYFKREPVRFSHAVSMLLTLSLASKQYAMQAKNISG
jgi:hypothetical protein